MDAELRAQLQPRSSGGHVLKQRDRTGSPGGRLRLPPTPEPELGPRPSEATSAPASHLPCAPLPAILSESPPATLEIPGPGKSRSSFQEILFLESPLTFGLGLAPRRHCFVLGCFYCYSLKILEPGCPGALAPFWAGPVSSWAVGWPGGGGSKGGRGSWAERGQTSLPETAEGGRGVPGRKP